jgi:hypothetical protein
MISEAPKPAQMQQQGAKCLPSPEESLAAVFGLARQPSPLGRITSPPSTACDTAGECCDGFGAAGTMADESELPSEQELGEAEIDSDEVGNDRGAAEMAGA